jgi:chromosome segregation ATPase
MMLRRMQCIMWLLLLLCSTVRYSLAQRRDPLNEKEVDEMREAADQPDKRLELLVKFARARMTSIDQLQANAKNAKDRPMQVHDLLEDFSSILDEIDDNIDMYASHKADMRKGLMLVIEASSEWQLKLRRLKEQSPPEELDQYSFVLASASDAVNDGGEDARQELQEQNQLAKQKKLTKVYSERPD